MANLLKFETLSIDPSGLGEGGFAKVYKANHPRHGTVAYKQVEIKSKSTVDEFKKIQVQLMNEAAIQSKLSHPNILRIIGLVFDHGNFGLVLEFMDNGDLYDYLHNNDVQWKLKLSFISDVTAGMHYLHSQEPPIIHGDLKIENVLINRHKTAKISDFGISRFKEVSTSISVNIVRKGTVTHFPPENWNDPNLRKMEPYDVYGYGILLWEITTERRPFANACGNCGVINGWVCNGERPGLEHIPQEVPNEIKWLMVDCWDGNVKKRPSFAEIESRVKNVQRTCQTEFVGKIEINENKELCGMTWLENKIYVVCRSNTKVQVFRDQLPFKELKEEEIEISAMKKPFDMVASTTNRCIFISDTCRSLWKIQIPNREISQHRISRPCGLSINFSDELIVMNDAYGIQIEIYAILDFKKIKSISMPKGIDFARYAAPLSNGNFIVSHHKTGSDSTRCEIGELLIGGNEFIRSFDRTSSVELDNWSPSSLAIDQDDRIFVAGGDKILLFNSMLTNYQILMKSDDQHQINRVCYLREKRQLIVGQWLPSDSTASISVFNLDC